MTFDDWITFIFDHPVTKPEWHWDINLEWPEINAATGVAYLTTIFETADTVLKPFSDAQVNQGLWLLFTADYMFDLRDTSVLLPDRLHCIYSMQTLFEKCFAVRCSPHLSHLDEPGVNPLNAVCYMWWDILPIHGLIHHQPERTDSAAIDRVCLEVMKRLLNINSIACQESAVHGLGEWSGYYPEVKTIVDSFLKKKVGMRPEMRAFTKWVRRGMS